MEWIKDRRLTIYLGAVCIFACSLAALSLGWVFTGDIFSFLYLPSNLANYEITIIDDHPCANLPYNFLIQIENKGPLPIQSYWLDEIYTVTPNQQQRALFMGGAGHTFRAEQTNDCTASIQDIAAGEKGYIYGRIPSNTPGGIPAEIVLKLCLKEQLKACRTEIIPWHTNTPVQNPQAMSDFQLSFVGVFPCERSAGLKVKAVFTAWNNGESILMRPKHTTRYATGDFRSGIYLSDDGKGCGPRRDSFYPHTETMLLQVWDNPPPPGTLVETTITMCSPMVYYVDKTLPCPSHSWEFFMPDE